MNKYEPPSRELNPERLAKLGLLAAISLALIWMIHFPIFPSASWLEYDPADVAILIGAFLYGPWAGLLLTIVASGLQSLILSAQSGVAGFIMHVVATGTFVVVSGLIYRRGKMKALPALLLGAASMVVMMVPLNLVVTPLFMGAPIQAVLDILLPVIIPFNAIKAFGNAILTFLLYKRVGHLLERDSI